MTGGNSWRFMALIKLDHAYCHEFDSVLTIYQVRDLHFDDDASFDARNAKFECPDEDCNAPLVGVNHASVKFKNTPHFRLLIHHKHSEACDYGNESNMKASDESKRKGTERNYKASYYPEVLLLERQPLPSGTGKPKKKRKAANPQTTVDASLSNSNSDNFPPIKPVAWNMSSKYGCRMTQKFCNIYHLPLVTKTKITKMPSKTSILSPMKKA